MALKNKKTNVEVEGGEILIRSSEGHYAIIPKQHVVEVSDMIKNGCDTCINAYLKTLPKEENYAADGTIIENTTEPPKKKVVGNSLVYSDPNDPEYKYRKQMYQDSLDLNKLSQLQYTLSKSEQKKLVSLNEINKMFEDNSIAKANNYEKTYNKKFDSDAPKPNHIDQKIINSNKNPNISIINRQSPEFFHKNINPIGYYVEGIDENGDEIKNYSFFNRINPSKMTRSFGAVNQYYKKPTTPILLEEKKEDKIIPVIKKQKQKSVELPKEQQKIEQPVINQNVTIEQKPVVQDIKQPEYIKDTKVWLNNTTPMLTYNSGTPQEKTVQLDINSPEVAEFYKQQGNKIVTDKITQEQLDLLLKKTKKEEKKK